LGASLLLLGASLIRGWLPKNDNAGRNRQWTIDDQKDTLDFATIISRLNPEVSETMSLRLGITACDLTRMHSWFGGQDQTLYKQILRELDDWAKPADAEEFAIFRDARIRLNGLINSGREKTAKKEREGDVWAAYVLARHAAPVQQPWDDDEEEEEWSWEDLYELSEQLGKRFDKRTKVLFKYLIDGRPLFGKRFSDDGGWYGYLVNSEVQELRQAISTVCQEVGKLVVSGALNAMDFDSGLVDVIRHMIETLARIERNRLDLFLYAS
jgi:hypothetical protein